MIELLVLIVGGALVVACGLLLYNYLGFIVAIIAILIGLGLLVAILDSVFGAASEVLNRIRVWTANGRGSAAAAAEVPSEVANELSAVFTRAYGEEEASRRKAEQERLFLEKTRAENQERRVARSKEVEGLIVALLSQLPKGHQVSLKQQKFEKSDLYVQWGNPRRLSWEISLETGYALRGSWEQDRSPRTFDDAKKLVSHLAEELGKALARQ